MDVAAIVGLVLLAAFTQSAFGFGFALVFTPLAAFAIGPHAAVETSIVLSSILSLIVYWEQRPREPVTAIAPLVIPALAAFPLGLILLVHVNESVLRIIVGVAVMGGALVNLRRTREAHAEQANRRPLMVLVGLASGVLRGATSMGGPPVVLYEHWLGGEAAIVRRRLFAYFALFGLPGIPIAMLGGALAPDIWKLVLLGLPTLGVGIAIGRASRAKLSERWFRRLSMGLLSATAATAVFGAAVAIR